METLRTLPDNSVDSVVTDPPYGLSFMGKKWDYDVPNVEIWAECLRVLKPGGHLLAFAGTRTQHRMAVRIEDAGFEIRDMIAWVYGSGFPKSMDVSKAIDKAANVPTDGAGFKRMLSDAVATSGITRKQIDEACGFTMRYDTPLEKDPAGWGCTYPGVEQWARIKRILPVPDGWDRFVAGVERDVLSRQLRKNAPSGIVSAGRESVEVDRAITAPATDAARQWDGWGTALKPALEPITVARKPLTGTVAANVLAHGTGALNIDNCRVNPGEYVSGGGNGKGNYKYGDAANYTSERSRVEPHTAGRWPANLIHDGSAEVVAMFPAEAGQQAALKTRNSDKTRNTFGAFEGTTDANFAPHDARGSAARFFYCAKTSRKDRNEGLTDPGPQFQHGTTLRKVENTATAGNTHPTVKPTDLMAYLLRLVTPPGGVVLDPFMGSGSTGKAAMREGFQFIGCELDEAYLAIARARIKHELVKVQIEREAPQQVDLFAAAE